MREAAELERCEAGFDRKAVRDRGPREARLELLADRAAALARGVAPARADPLVARLGVNVSRKPGVSMLLRWIGP
jgi:hypothetical protein